MSSPEGRSPQLPEGTARGFGGPFWEVAIRHQDAAGSAFSTFEHSGLDEEDGDGGNADHRDSHGHKAPTRDSVRVAASAHDALFKGPGSLNGGVVADEEDEGLPPGQRPRLRTQRMRLRNTSSHTRA